MEAINGSHVVKELNQNDVPLLRDAAVRSVSPKNQVNRFDEIVNAQLDNEVQMMNAHRHLLFSLVADSCQTNYFLESSTKLLLPPPLLPLVTP